MKPLLLTCLCAAAWGQLPAPNAAGVSMGHLHLNVRDLDASRRFFVEMGATPLKLGSMDVMKFPDVLVLLKKQDPTGGSIGTTVNHVGFRVKDLEQVVTKWKAAGFHITPGASPTQVFVMSPDDLRIEITEDRSMTVPIANHHIHFWDSSVEDTKAWYVKKFGAKPGRRGKFEAADLPGVNLSFTLSPTPVVGTKGRALDHIGFEVRDLEAFCQKMEAAGVKFDVPYKKIDSLGIAVAFFTDPWGTYVELTEGLNKL
jgi:catechol 2,3-dioxygenase-like lactoylglutathione lyase family enzyme